MYYSIRRWLKWELPNYPSYFVEGFKNIISWFPIVWGDRDWDDHYIWEVIKFKLSKQAKYIKTQGRHVSAERDSEIMMTCVRLMDKIQHEDYSSEYMDYYQAEINFIDSETNKGCKETDITEISERFDEYFAKYPLVHKKVKKSKKPLFPKNTKRGKAMNIGHINHQRARKLLFNILENNIERWWN